MLAIDAITEVDLLSTRLRISGTDGPTPGVRARCGRGEMVIPLHDVIEGDIIYHDGGWFQVGRSPMLVPLSVIRHCHSYFVQGTWWMMMGDQDGYPRDPIHPMGRPQGRPDPIHSRLEVHRLVFTPLN